MQRYRKSPTRLVRYFSITIQEKFPFSPSSLVICYLSKLIMSICLTSKIKFLKESLRKQPVSHWICT